MPPGDLCSDCDSLWAAFDGLLVLAHGDVRLAAPSPHRSLTEAISTAQEVAVIEATYCRYQREILAFDAKRLERDHRYFTWTRTWHDFEAVVEALRNSGVECR